jgi:hypothetical protein
VVVSELCSRVHIFLSHKFYKTTVKQDQKLVLLGRHNIPDIDEECNSLEIRNSPPTHLEVEFSRLGSLRKIILGEKHVDFVSSVTYYNNMAK